MIRTAGLPFGKSDIADVLNRILHVGDITQPHRCAIFVRDNQPSILFGA